MGQMVDVDKVRWGRMTQIRLGEDNYVVWSSITDAPCVWSMTRDECIELMQHASWMDDFGSNRGSIRERIRRLDETGVGDHGFGRSKMTAEEYTEFNCAGPNGECLTFEALKRRFGPGDAYENFELQDGDVIPWED
jgi:hypothetical protein